jgi:hypothetical protein
LKIPDRYEPNIPKLYACLVSRPDLNIDDYLGTFAAPYRKMIKTSLEEQAKVALKNN